MLGMARMHREACVPAVTVNSDWPDLILKLYFLLFVLARSGWPNEYAFNFCMLRPSTSKELVQLAWFHLKKAPVHCTRPGCTECPPPTRHRYSASHKVVKLL